MPRRIMFLICLLGLSLAAGPAAGRVFWRRAAAGAAVFDNTPGWRTVYRGAVRINGRPGAVQVAVCEEPVAAVGERLRAAWGGAGADFEFSADSGIRYGVARAAGRVRRFLLLEMADAGTTVVFALDQAGEDYRASLAPPAGAALGALPVYPGSAPRLLVENEETRAGLQVGMAPAGAEAVAGFYRQALAERGFRPLLPETGPGAGGGSFLIYGRGGALCCVLARDGGAPAQCTVTLLYKSLRME